MDRKQDASKDLLNEVTILIENNKILELRELLEEYHIIDIFEIMENLEENENEKSLAKPEDDFDPMAQMNKNMNMMFPIMYVAVALVAPLGLALYWLMNSLLMIIERLILNKLLKDEEEE